MQTKSIVKRVIKASTDKSTNGITKSVNLPTTGMNVDIMDKF